METSKAKLNLLYMGLA